MSAFLGVLHILFPPTHTHTRSWWCQWEICWILSKFRKLPWFGLMSSPSLALTLCANKSCMCRMEQEEVTKAFRITCKGTWLFEVISVLMAPCSLGVSTQNTPSSPYCLACSQRLWNTCLGSFVRGILPCEIKEKLVKKGLKISVEMWHMNTGTVWIKS